MSILGTRAKTIPFINKNDFFEFIGYLCTPGRVQSIDAEIPKKLEASFKKIYSGKNYRIKQHPLTPSGFLKKWGPQFRINLNNKNNAPLSFNNYLRKGNKSCKARINRSKLVEDLVLKYGFTFSRMQNCKTVKSKIPSKYHADYQRGYNL